MATAILNTLGGVISSKHGELKFVSLVDRYNVFSVQYENFSAMNDKTMNSMEDAECIA